MKSYVLVTGILFALLALAHVARIAAENPRLAFDPFFLVITLLSAALAIWAWRLFRTLR